MRITTLSVLLPLAAAVSGCAFKPQVTHMAVEYNEFVAQATNRQTVINILRARDREPLHFTSFTQVHGTAQMEGSASLEAAFGGTAVERSPATAPATDFAVAKKTAAGTSLTPSLGITVNTGTTFDIAINATDDFWKGILKPIDPETIVYYLRQGWSPDLITDLFVERMDFSVTISRKADPANHVEAFEKTIPLRTVANDISSEAKAAPFQESAACRLLDTHAKSQDEEFVELRQLSDLNGVSKEAIGQIKIPDPAPGAPARERPAQPYLQLSPAGTDFGIALSERTSRETCLAEDRRIVTWMRGSEANQHLRSDLMKQNGEAPETLPPSVDASFDPAKNVQRLVTPGRRILGFSLRSDGLVPSSGGAGFRAEGYCNQVVQPGLRCDLSVVVTLRSTEGIIYYLGEYVRECGAHPAVRGSGEERVPIIAIRNPIDFARTLNGLQPPCSESGRLLAREKSTGKLSSEFRDLLRLPFVEVDYKGLPYVVYSSGQNVGSVAGRSSEVITLVQQLLNLYRTAKDLPTTPYVRVLN